MSKRFEISHRTIIFIALMVFFIWLVTQVWDILLLFFVAVILMSALKPWVDWLEAKGVSRTFSIIIIYILLWTVLGALIASIVPALIQQTRNLVAFFPTSSAGNNILSIPVNQPELFNNIVSKLGSLPESLFKIVISIFGNVVNFLTTVVLAFYLLLERKNLDQHLVFFIGHRPSRHISQTISEIEVRLGSWVRGELILMTSIGLATYIGLRLLGIESALPLAILAGLLEIVPNIGPIISAVPAVIIALFVHPVLALSTAALYFLIQFLENNILVPQVMRRVTGINPLISLPALMIGFRLAGIAGALLSLPIVLVIQSVGLKYFSISNLEKISEE